MSTKKPSEYRAFENLTKQLMGVPKSELDKKADEYNPRKERRKKKKGKWALTIGEVR